MTVTATQWFSFAAIPFAGIIPGTPCAIKTPEGFSPNSNEIWFSDCSKLSNAGLPTSPEPLLLCSPTFRQPVGDPYV
jgi:hypothetical protein